MPSLFPDAVSLGISVGPKLPVHNIFPLKVNSMRFASSDKREGFYVYSRDSLIVSRRKKCLYADGLGGRRGTLNRIASDAERLAMYLKLNTK